MTYEKKPFYASKTAIYDWLYSSYGQKYCRHLLSKRYNKRKRRGKKQKRQMIPDRISIHDRGEMGYRDYEGDTIVSKKNTVSIVTVYGPVNMYLDARKILNLKPVITAKAFKSMFEKVKVNSMTLDNGQENKLHKNIGIKTYFCDAYASWQKPGIENANKLIRRHIPKGSNISEFSHQYISWIVRRYNNMPRKKLGWMIPNEVMRKKKLFKKEKRPRIRSMQ